MFSKFLDPKNDVAFKRIFGNEKNEDILIHFLNDVITFQGKRPICKIQLLKTILDPEIAVQKTSIVDVFCEDDQGSKYIVEMQVANTTGFEKRAQYYAAKAYCSQAHVGGKYEDLKEVIFLAIADYVMFPQKKDYKSDHMILDKKTYTQDLKDFSFTFIELPKFIKTVDELSTLEEKWCYFFKHADEVSPENLSKLIGEDLIIERVYRELDRFSWTKEELRAYESAEKARNDYISSMNKKHEEGRAEERAKAELEKAELLAQSNLEKAELLAQSDLEKAELLAQSDLEKADLLAQFELEKAELQAKIELEKIQSKKKLHKIAAQFLQQGLPIATVMEMTGLSEEITSYTHP